MFVRNQAATPEIRHEQANTGPCLRWLASLVAVFTVLGIALTHFGQMFIH